MKLEGVTKAQRKRSVINGVKCRLIAQLCHRDPDFKFEYAVRGVDELLRAYTCKQLKERLTTAHRDAFLIQWVD